MAHPHEHTLKLLKLSVDLAPPFFPEDRQKQMHDEVERISSNTESTLNEIEDLIILFGKEIWPYRKAFAEIHDKEGRVREDKYLKEELKEVGLLDRYLDFLARGHRVEDVRHGDEFEKFFTPDERAKLVQAKLSVHDRVLKEIRDMCIGEKGDECTLLISSFKEEQKEIERQIQIFAAMAHQSEKWGPEIRGKVKMFEEGWSGVEKDVTSEDVCGEIEYYQGVIQLFE